MNNPMRFFAPVAFATLFGPLSAGLLFCLLSVVTALFASSGELSLPDLFKMFAVYILFAYLEGAKIAIVGGLLLAMWMIWRPPSLVAANVAAIAAVLLYRAAAGLGLLNEIDAGAMRNNLALYIVLAVFAACVCWFATRRWIGRI